MSTTTTRHARSWDQQRSWPALLVILCLHAAGLWGLMQIKAVREAVQDITPIMVGMITVPQPEPPKPVMEPPPPTPVPDRPKPKPQMIAAQTPAPAVITAPPPEPVIVEAPPPPPAAAAEPAPVIPPNFVAAYLDNPPPAYPLSSKRLGETGTVLLRVRVSELGRAESVELERSSGFARLDRAAIDAVRQWKFVPAKQADVAVPAYVLIPLNFELSAS